MSVQTFWLEPTDQVALGLRRYTHGSGGFTCADGYHSALVYTGRGPVRTNEHGDEIRPDLVPHDDPRWPAACDACHLEFPDDAEHQEWSLRIWRRTDTGQERVLHTSAGAPFAPSAEPGACWDAFWLHPIYAGPDGMTLMVRCPDGHDWCVDSRASNCGRPDDDTHKCWVRHGEPRECRVTVDKNGDTCQAGAGSIQTPNWHGFLRDGILA